MGTRTDVFASTLSSERVEKATWEFHFHTINELEIISVVTGVGKVSALVVALLVSFSQMSCL